MKLKQNKSLMCSTMKYFIWLFASYLSLSSAYSAGQAITPKQIIDFDSTIDDIINILHAKKIHSIESAVALFDKEFFRFGSYAFIFESESPQLGTVDFPRIVLFGKNGLLRIGFNHKSNLIARQRVGPRMSESPTLEIIQYRGGAKKWEFREITFGRTFKISEVNPRQCLFCHGGANAKPKLDQSTFVTASVLSKTISKKSPSWREFLKSKIGEDPIYSRFEMPTSQ